MDSKIYTCAGCDLSITVKSEADTVIPMVCPECNIPLLPTTLSRRELEVAKLFAYGHKTVIIADMLFISTKTVDAHKRTIFHKLGLSNLVQLTRYALKHGLASLE